MELLNALKKYQNYKKLRKEELAIKNLLKKKISKVKEEIRNFDSLIPKTENEKFSSLGISRAPKKRKDLQEEIEDIRRKISELQ